MSPTATRAIKEDKLQFHILTLDETLHRLPRLEDWTGRPERGL
jgi:hypothetical protein